MSSQDIYNEIIKLRDLYTNNRDDYEPATDFSQIILEDDEVVDFTIISRELCELFNVNNDDIVEYGIDYLIIIIDDITFECLLQQNEDFPKSILICICVDDI